MPIPGPLGDTPAPGNPPTASKPTGTPQPAGASQPPNLTSLLSQLAGGQLSGLLGGFLQGNAGLNMQAGAAYGQAGTTDAQLLSQLQNTLGQLGIQHTGLGQEQAYQTGEYGLGQQQFGVQGQQLANELANLKAQYGLEQQQFGLQGAEIGQQRSQALRNLNEQTAAAGTYTTGTLGQGQSDIQTQFIDAMKQLGISEAQAKQQFQTGLQSNQLSGKQLGIEEQQAKLGYGYQQQQLQNALAQLGLSTGQAGQQYKFGTQAAGNELASVLGGLTQQAGGLQQQTDQSGSGIFADLLKSLGY